MPQPSVWSAVRPARWAKPVKLNVTSVGVLAFMPSSWHMGGGPASGLAVQPELAACGPVLALDVGDQDVHRLGRAAQHFHGHAGDLFGQLALLLDGAAFHHFDVVGGHGDNSWRVEQGEGRETAAPILSAAGADGAGTSRAQW